MAPFKGYSPWLFGARKISKTLALKNNLFGTFTDFLSFVLNSSSAWTYFCNKSFRNKCLSQLSQPYEVNLCIKIFLFWRSLFTLKVTANEKKNWIHMQTGCLKQKHFDFQAKILQFIAFEWRYLGRRLYPNFSHRNHCLNADLDEHFFSVSRYPLWAKIWFIETTYLVLRDSWLIYAPIL